MSRDQYPSFLFADQALLGDDTFLLEQRLIRQGFSIVAGVDEAGRGPLAGPVVAGCVVLPADCDYSRFQDSKKLTARRREKRFAELHDCGAHIGVGQCSPREIEEKNILQASLLAMKRAIEDCLPVGLPDFLLIDGTFPVPITLPQQTLIKGESKSASIAAASIIAKVTRDRLMAQAHADFPHYNFMKNQGYPTREHREAIADFGPCPLHRRTFKGVREFVKDNIGKSSSPSQYTLWK